MAAHCITTLPSSGTASIVLSQPTASDGMDPADCTVEMYDLTPERLKDLL